MSLLGYKILATDGFSQEVTMISFRDKTIISKACMSVVTKEGFTGKTHNYYKGDFELLEIVHEEEASSDTGQRIKHAAIGAAILGPIGLLGAAFGGRKTILKVKFVTKDSKKFLLELDIKECQKLFLVFLDIDLAKEANKQLL